MQLQAKTRTRHQAWFMLSGMKTNLKPHLAVLGANIIYGANYAIAKDLLTHYLPPFGFIILRVFFSTILFWLMHAIFIREPIERKDIPRFILFAIFGVSVNQLLFFKGISLTLPINASLMMTTNGVQVLLIAAIVLKEKISRQKISGIILGITGACTIILYGKEFSIHSDTFMGDLIIFMNSLSWAYYLVIAKPMLQKYKAITVMKWMFLFGNFIVIPFGYNELMTVQWSTLPASAYWGIVFVVFGATFMAYLLNIYGLQYLHSSVVSAYVYLQPALATLFSIIFGQGKPQWIHLLATILIFAGVYLVSKKENTAVVATPKHRH